MSQFRNLNACLKCFGCLDEIRVLMYCMSYLFWMSWWITCFDVKDTWLYYDISKKWLFTFSVSFHHFTITHLRHDSSCVWKVTTYCNSLQHIYRLQQCILWLQQTATICKRDDILQKRPVILRSLLIEATPSGAIGRLPLIGSLKLQVSFAEYRLFYMALWQKRRII